MLDLDSSVTLLLNAYTSAVRARDVEAFMDLYDANARVFDTWGVWSYESANARRDTIVNWFASLGTEYVVVTFDDVRIQGGAELALVSAFATFTGFSTEGKVLRSMQNRWTWAVRRDATGVKVVHEHTSVPISFTDTTAIFHRA